jgi:uncharacterized protein YjbI with pentapeptide repeats
MSLLRLAQRVVISFASSHRRRLETIPHTPWIPRPIRTWVLPFALLTIALGGWLYFDLQMAEINQVGTPTDGQARLEITKMRLEIIRNTLTVAAGLGGAAALILSFRRQQHEEFHSTQQRISELRIQAVEQLSSESSTVRIGGLHNLERLGVQNEDLRQVILDEICSYLRQPFSSVDANDPEREVRRFAQEILQRRLKRRLGRRGYWSHERIDLEGAFLWDADFSVCHLRYANFERATFQGMTLFLNTSFGGSARFEGACFEGFAMFHRARFDGITVFKEVSFNGLTFFAESTFKQRALFDGTFFNTIAYFDKVVFHGIAGFSKSHFKLGLNLEKATFYGETDFEEAVIDFKANFSSAKFHKQVKFESTAFLHEAEFRKVTFGNSVRFNKAVFVNDPSFWGALFNQPASFTDTSFKDTPKFNEVKLKKILVNQPIPGGWRPEVERIGLCWRWVLRQPA